MRPGSHHLINNLISGKPAEGFVAGRSGCDGTGMGGFQGTQNLITESPPQGIPAPENAGLGRTLPHGIRLEGGYLNQFIRSRVPPDRMNHILSVTTNVTF